MKPKRPSQHLRRAAYWLDDYADGLRNSYALAGDRTKWHGCGAAKAMRDYGELRELAAFVRRMAKDVA